MVWMICIFLLFCCTSAFANSNYFDVPFNWTAPPSWYNSSGVTLTDYIAMGPRSSDGAYYVVYFNKDSNTTVTVSPDNYGHGYYDINLTNGYGVIIAMFQSNGTPYSGSAPWTSSFSIPSNYGVSWSGSFATQEGGWGPDHFFSSLPITQRDNMTYDSNYYAGPYTAHAGDLFAGTVPQTTGPQLTINIDPETGGSVTTADNVVACNVDNTCAACQYSLSQVSTSNLQANPKDGYAFGYWVGKENPHAMTTSGDTTITAKFFRTFTDAATNGFSEQIGDTGGQCVQYVRTETGILNSCTGYAVDCLGQAKAAGYQTGTSPRIGAIAVFFATDELPYGHVGIVKSFNDSYATLRESNWCTPATCLTVGEHDENFSSGRIMGYIYPAP